MEHTQVSNIIKNYFCDVHKLIVVRWHHANFTMRPLIVSFLFEREEIDIETDLLFHNYSEDFMGKYGLVPCFSAGSEIISLYVSVTVTLGTPIVSSHLLTIVTVELMVALLKGGRGEPLELFNFWRHEWFLIRGRGATANQTSNHNQMLYLCTSSTPTKLKLPNRQIFINNKNFQFISNVFHTYILHLKCFH